MQQKFNQKMTSVLFIAALVMMSACSSSQVDDLTAPTAETAAATDASAPAPDASTDAVPTIDSTAAAPAAPVAENAALADQPPAVSPDAPPASDPGALTSAPTPDAIAPASDPSLDAPMADPSTAAVTETPPAATEGTTTVSPDSMAVNFSNDAVPSDTPGKKKHKKKHGAAHVAQASGDGVNYNVKQGDTLMKIAFEQYGDLYRWKEIFEANRDRIQDPNSVPPGTQLALNGAGMVTIEHNGDSYLIKHGDTLGVISKDIYGTPAKWKRLWENNRQLIKDPNKIYAGFYLFYQPEGKLTNEGQSADPSAQVQTVNPTQQTAQVIQQAAPAAKVQAANMPNGAPRTPASVHQ
jgi:nucleoid-associated protein YgaU